MDKSAYQILVIDDDPDIGLMIKIVLEYKGYKVLVAERPDKAATHIREKLPDLIVMDMLLSGVDGTDICKQLKQDPLTAPVPIIMISAHPNAKEICMEAGADDFVLKPFDIQDLISKISWLLSSRQTK
ncbi:MAG: response regulator [Chitinophagaceae bacterium]